MSSEEKKDATGYWRIPEWFPELGQDNINKLRSYYTELIFFNGRMNLISPRTELNADLIHFADGILGSRKVIENTKCKEIFDIGSGNGIPGIVLGLLYPDIKVTLVDADARKIEFMKHISSRLGLKNVSTMHARLEDLGEGTIQCAVSRGFASISKALLMSRKTAAPNCEFYHFKGQAWSKELAEVPSQVLAHWEPEKVLDYSLPTGNTTLTIVLTKRKG